MRDRFILLLYAGGVVALTALHDLRPMAGALLFGIAVARHRAAACKRILLVLLLFGLPVSAVHMLTRAGETGRAWEYALLVNLRLASISSLGFGLLSRVDPIRSLAVTPSIGRLVAIAYGQIITHGRLQADARDALRSRTPGRIGLREAYAQIAACGIAFLEKAVVQSEDVVLGMRSRGALDDRDAR